MFISRSACIRIFFFFVDKIKIKIGHKTKVDEEKKREIPNKRERSGILEMRLQISLDKAWWVREHT